MDMPEFGEASIIQMLTGWVPETTTLQTERCDSLL